MFLLYIKKGFITRKGEHTMGHKNQQVDKEAFEQLLSHAIAGAANKDHPFSLLLLDIDQFRRVNETCGHGVGDQVLADVLAIVQEQIGDTDHFARWGGDEFAILVSNADLKEAEALAGRIRGAVEAHEFPQAGRVTVTLGVTAYRAGDSPEGQVERADEAVRRAKQEGRNRVVVAG
jgi:diguanylate cyclase (GGDEF)-like protein